MSCIGSSLGVTKQAVRLWLGGGAVSQTVLILAGLLAGRGPVEWPL